MSFRDRVEACNTYDLSGFLPFCCTDQHVGWVRHALAEKLQAFPAVFAIAPSRVTLHPSLPDRAARDRALAHVASILAAQGDIPSLRDEYYGAINHIGQTPPFVLDRAAVPAFGIRGFGVHMNGYVIKDDGLHMWVGKRAKDKPTFPGMLDNMVAGGQPHGLGLMENLIKECAEEAAIPAALAQQARPVGAITYCSETADGLKPDTQYCYDLQVPESFTPRNTDGELEGFDLWPLQQVIETVRDTALFKPNCNLVIIDFLVRHGLLGPEEPDYLQIVNGLRAPLPGIDR